MIVQIKAGLSPAEDGSAGVALLGSGAVPGKVPGRQAYQDLHLLCGLVLQLGFL